jgi:AcrR family transcriptional regulator
MFCDPADTTRDRLLDTAERLFAEHGYQATTMRAVTTEAAANIAAVNYHFGSKQALLEAEPTVEAIVDAIIGPLIERVGTEPDPARVIRLLGRLFVDPDPEMRALVKAEIADAEKYQLGVLERALPGVPREELWLRMRSMFAVVGAHLTGAFDSPASCPPGCDELRARLVSFLAAGMRAPATVLTPV